MKLLIDGRGKRWLVTKDEIHTNRGVVKLKDAKPGDTIKSHTGHKFFLLDPLPVDIYEKMPRAGSFMFKKDIGQILAYTGVGNGDIVVDAGTGSGALVMFLANVVRPDGKVYTYEIRPEFADIARKNFKIAGLEDFIELKVKDINDGIDEHADLITLDMNAPWMVVKIAHRALKMGGFIAVYTPYIEHAKMTVVAISKEGFKDIKTIESINREMEFRTQGTRPKTRMVGHTGYLTFGRKY